MSRASCADAWLLKHPMVGVLRAGSAEVALEQARAALDAGLDAVEITFTVPGAPRLIETLAAHHPRAAIGAGTLLSPQDVRDAAAAGASFLVSPHLDESLIAAALDVAVPYLPGVSTPSEVVRARQLGCPAVKLFPIDLLGGPAYVRALRGPFPDLEVLVTGGVAASQIRAYFASGARSVGLGSIFLSTPEATGSAVRSMVAAA